MDKEIERFLNEIKNEYCIKLYNSTYIDYEIDDKPLDLKFPFCCQLSAQLISSFLYVHVSETSKCIQAEFNCPKHFWTELDDEIIDYTDFQYDLDHNTKDGFLKHLISDEDLQKIIENHNIVYHPRDHSHKLMPEIELTSMNLLGVEIAKKFPFNKIGFLNYVDEAIQEIQPKLNY